MTLSDMLYFPVQAVSFVFSILDGAMIDSYSLLDYFLAFMYLAVTLEFIFSLFNVDIDFWDYILGDDE